MAEKVNIVITGKDKASRTIDKVTKKTRNLTKSIKDNVLVFSAISGAMMYGGKQFLDLAGNAEEVQSKFDVVFKGIEKEVGGWAKTFSKSIGRSETEVKEYSSSLGDILKPMGLTTEEAAEMSKSMTELALDVSSFNNRQDPDVVRAFASALTGERESLKTLGISIYEADVKQEALSLGLVKQEEELTKTAKAQATVSLLYKNTKDAQGDLLRTQGSYTNQVKKLNSKIKELGESIGKELIPIITPLIANVSDLTEWFTDLSPQIRKVIVIVAVAVTLFAGLLAVLGLIVTIAPAIAGAWVLITGPIGLVAIAIALLGVAWATNIWGIRDKTLWVVDKIKGIFFPFMDALILGFQLISTEWDLSWGSMYDYVVDTWDGIVAYVTDKAKYLTDTINELLSYVGLAETKTTNVSTKTSASFSPLGETTQSSDYSFPKFAGGGIINKPTIGLIGEGRMNEAIVPLPNGKAIPVVMNNAQGVTININNPSVRNDDDIDSLANQVGRVLARQLNLSTNRLAT